MFMNVETSLSPSEDVVPKVMKALAAVCKRHALLRAHWDNIDDRELIVPSPDAPFVLPVSKLSVSNRDEAIQMFTKVAGYKSFCQVLLNKKGGLAKSLEMALLTTHSSNKPTILFSATVLPFNHGTYYLLILQLTENRTDLLVGISHEILYVHSMANFLVHLYLYLLHNPKGYQVVLTFLVK